ncbi:MAG: hypothetical protein K1X74_13270 [Pirellulales bacterium]|nr:hypothetical protein [Pirellulales bacterium]
MKRFGLSALSLLLACALLPPRAAGDDDTLAWRFQPGESLLWSTDQELRNASYKNKVRYETVNHSEIGICFDVREVDASGVAAAQMRFEYLALEISNPQRRVAFDSRKPEENVAARNAARLYAPFFTVVINVRITPAGNFVDIRVPEHTVEVAMNVPGRERLIGLLRPETFADGFQQLSGPGWVMFPENPPGAHSVWEHKLVAKAQTGLLQRLTTRYEVAGIEMQKDARIARIKFTGSTSFNESSGVSVTRQEHQGEATFDLTAGRLIGAQQRQSLDLELMSPAGPVKQQLDATTKNALIVRPAKPAGPAAPPGNP